MAAWVPFARWLAMKGIAKGAGKFGASTSRRRMKKKAAQIGRARGGRRVIPMAPAPQGPYARRMSTKKNKQSNKGTSTRFRRARGGGPRTVNTSAKNRGRVRSVQYRRGVGCPKGYRYDPRTKKCIHNNYK
jgi:hypothetical protein